MCAVELRGYIGSRTHKDSKVCVLVLACWWHGEYVGSCGDGNCITGQQIYLVFGFTVSLRWYWLSAKLVVAVVDFL